VTDSVLESMPEEKVCHLTHRPGNRLKYLKQEGGETIWNLDVVVLHSNDLWLLVDPKEKDEPWANPAPGTIVENIFEFRIDVGEPTYYLIADYAFLGVTFYTKEGNQADLARLIREAATDETWCINQEENGSKLRLSKQGRRLLLRLADQVQEKGWGTLADILGTERTEPDNTPSAYMSVFNPPHYQALREALAKREFDDGIPWPTAPLDKGGARGYAQLRPLAADDHRLSPQEEEPWVQIMRRYRDELSDLDVDALDALSAIWLQQAGRPGVSALADVDDLLRMRGVKPKLSGSGRRGGYEPEQRAEMMAALSRLQSVWLDMAEVDVVEETVTQTGRQSSRRTKQTIQSRVFVITDRMGHKRPDGFMDVRKFIFQPGAVFAKFLSGPGRQTALLSAKALEFDPYRQVWEKRLTRYLSWQWRARAYNGNYFQPYRVKTLLEAVGGTPDAKKPSRTRDRLEKALDTLLQEGVIAGWQYDLWDEATAQRQGWVKRWMQATIAIEPPDEVAEHYRSITRNNKAALLNPEPEHNLGERIRQHRQKLGLTQLQAAEQLGITQGYLSQLEHRRRRKPSPALLEKIEAWLNGGDRQ